MPAPIRVLVDLRPTLLADAVAVAVRSAGALVEVVVGDDDEVVHDDTGFDLVVVGDEVRAARPGRLTTCVRDDVGDALQALQDLVAWMLARQSRLG